MPKFCMESNRVAISVSDAPICSLLVAAMVGFHLGWPSAATAAEEETVTQQQRAAILKTFRDEVTPFLKKYCTECHRDARRNKGDVEFGSTFSRPGAGEFRKLWQAAMANVREHAMPPEDAKNQPTEQERKKFIEWVPKVRHLNPKDPGPFVIRRLNKVEYANTLRDLLGIDPSVARDLPDEVPGEGYLNTISPLQSEQYLTIANEAVSRALGPTNGQVSEKQRQLLGATPANERDYREAAKKVSRSLARKAFRRPATDGEIEVLMRVFDLARDNKLDYQRSLRLVLKAILVSPQFLFITPAKEPPADQSIVPLDDHQIASRLSYFLWSTMPDAELSGLADGGRLNEPATIRAQVVRMLSDNRSRALFDGFGQQWLGIGGLKEKRFDPVKFPEMTPALREAMHEEARLFFEALVRENRPVADFINGDFIFVNEGLAKIYGLQEKVSGPQMRRVQIKDPNRGGILGMPATLAITSFPDRTSAVKRGAWVLEQVMGEHIPPAPPNVPALEKQDMKKVAGLTLRQRTELHRSNAVCANCHKIMDPIGFGLENFDAIGRWRDKDESGGPIDAGGQLPGGKKFHSPKELKAILAERKDDLARNLAEKLLAYALCRQLEGYDLTVVDQILGNIRKENDRLQPLIMEVATSYPFTHRRIK